VIGTIAGVVDPIKWPQFLAAWNASSVNQYLPAQAVPDVLTMYYYGMIVIRNAFDELFTLKHNCTRHGWNMTRDGVQRTARVNQTRDLCSPQGDCSERCSQLAWQGEDRIAYGLMKKQDFMGYSGFFLLVLSLFSSFPRFHQPVIILHSAIAVRPPFRFVMKCCFISV
jgi:hypothetical protein